MKTLPRAPRSCKHLEDASTESARGLGIAGETHGRRKPTADRSGRSGSVFVPRSTTPARARPRMAQGRRRPSVGFPPLVGRGPAEGGERRRQGVSRAARRARAVRA